MNVYLKALLVLAVTFLSIAALSALALAMGRGEGFGAAAEAFWLPGLLFLGLWLAVRANHSS